MSLELMRNYTGHLLKTAARFYCISAISLRERDECRTELNSKYSKDVWDLCAE